jgi:hypothetical protein
MRSGGVPRLGGGAACSGKRVRVHLDHDVHGPNKPPHIGRLPRRLLAANSSPFERRHSNGVGSEGKSFGVATGVNSNARNGSGTRNARVFQCGQGEAALVDTAIVEFDRLAIILAAAVHPAMSASECTK